jgi:hypothetical protein
VDKAYYSGVAGICAGVWARCDAKIVRLFNERMEAIAVHVRQSGKFKTDPAHIHDHKRTLIERADWILTVSATGPGQHGPKIFTAARR